MSTEFKSNANECDRELEVNCEQTNPNFEAPEIGCEHIKSIVKRTRSEPNNLVSALCDIVDNVVGEAFKLKKEGSNDDIVVHLSTIYSEVNKDELVELSISDNIPRGFENILKKGINSPLNLGHVRDGHTDDDETSEFGHGLKKAIMNLGNNADIYTRSISDNETDTCVHVGFNIEKMCGKSRPEKSYEPTIFETISLDKFKENHHNNFSYGSTISLSQLRLDSILYNRESSEKLSTKEDLEEYLIENLSITYSKIITKKVFGITLNGKNINPTNDLTELIPDSNIIRNRLYIKLNILKGNIEKTCRKGKTPTGRDQYCEYIDDAKTSKEKYKHINAETFNSFIAEPHVYKLDMISLTTLGTDYSNILHNDKTYVSRNGRQFYPFIKITPQASDGYSNHIYNRIEYTSKRLNKFMGVGSNKEIRLSNNILMNAILFTQKETTNKFRSRSQSRTQPNVQPEIQINVQPEIQTNVQPEIQTNVQPEIIPVQINAYKKCKSNSKSQSKPQLEEIELEEIPIEEPQIEEIPIEEPQIEEIPIEEPQIEEPQIEEPQIEEPQIEEIPIEEPQIEEAQIEEPQIEEIPIEEPQIEEIHHEDTQIEEIPIEEIQHEDTQIEEIPIEEIQHEDTQIEEIPIEEIQHEDTQEESKEKLRRASQIIMELIANPDFGRNDGHKVLEFINMYVSNISK
jgi:hypothetical protein